MNNFYGWAMSEYLPHKEFNWLKSVDEFVVMTISEKSLTGYLLEVDFKSPDELYELYNDYPLAPEKLAVSSDMLLKYCKKVVFILSLELKLTKIHRVLKLKQSERMKKLYLF